MNNKEIIKKNGKWILLLAGGILLILLFITIYVWSAMGELNSTDEADQKYGELPYYSMETHGFISPQIIVRYPERTTGGSMGFARFFKKSPYAPKQALPKVQLTRNSFLQIPAAYALYWFGHSSAIIELDGVRILIDPVLGNAAPFPFIVPRYTESPITADELPDVDMVLLTHDHYDHLEMRTIKALKKRNIRFVVPLGVGTRLIGWGVPQEHITEMGWGDSLTYRSLRINACKTIHYSGRSGKDENRTLWAAYTIKGQQKNIFWGGDSGYGRYFKEIGEKYGPFDLACIEIDAWNNGWPNTHLFPHQVVEVCKDVKAKTLLPIHWGVFDLALHPWNESIQTVYNLATAQHIEMLTPLMGERVIPGITKTKIWWE